MRNISRVLLVLLPALAGRPTAAAGPPTLTVTGRTILRLTSVQRSARGVVRIRGDLRDAELLTGIEGEVVVVRLALSQDSSERRAVRTDRHGVFEVAWPLPLGSYRVDASYRGSRLHAPSQVGPLTLDVSKLSVGLELRVSSIGSARSPGAGQGRSPAGRHVRSQRKEAGTLDATAPRQRIEVTARADGEPCDVPVVLSGPTGALGAVRTGPSGSGALELPTHRLGQPGPLTLVGTFDGDERSNPSTTALETLLVTPVTIDLSLGAAAVAADGRIDLQGSARDIRGPIANGTVSLHALGHHRLTRTTDDRGRFRFALQASWFPPGALDLEVRFIPAVLWREASAEATVVRILPPQPIGVWVYAVPVMATTLVLGGLLLVRFRPVIARRLAWRPHRQSARRDAREPLRSGVQLSRTSLRQLFVSDDGISGTVWDAADDRALSGAIVEVTRESDGLTQRQHTAIGLPGTRRMACNPGGEFVAENLAPGCHRVRVSKPGYVAETFAIQLPHRGNLRGLRVLLVPVRVRVLELYRQAALPRLPDRAHWACWTPRELLQHLRRVGADSQSFEQLSTLLENVYWAPCPAAESTIVRARELARLSGQP